MRYGQFHGSHVAFNNSGESKGESLNSERPRASGKKLQPGAAGRRDTRNSGSEALLFSTELLAQARIHVGRVGLPLK